MSFAKRQREQAKRDKKQAKAERRAQRKTGDAPDTDTDTNENETPPVDVVVEAVADTP